MIFLTFFENFRAWKTGNFCFLEWKKYPPQRDHCSRDPPPSPKSCINYCHSLRSFWILNNFVEALAIFCYFSQISLITGKLRGHLSTPYKLKFPAFKNFLQKMIFLKRGFPFICFSVSLCLVSAWLMFNCSTTAGIVAACSARCAHSNVRGWRRTRSQCVCVPDVRRVQTKRNAELLRSTWTTRAHWAQWAARAVLHLLHTLRRTNHRANYVRNSGECVSVRMVVRMDVWKV